MKLQLSLSSLGFLLMFSIPLTVKGQKQLVVTQPEMVKAEAGQSVTITCSFTTEFTAYSATWTLGCNKNAPSLQHQPCFQRRVNVSSSDPVQISHSPQVLSYEMESSITIINLTENDSGWFCCHIEVRKDTGSGPGTRLEVTRRSFPAGQPKDEKTPQKMYIRYAVIGLEACAIIILIAVVIRHRPRGMSRSEDKGLQLDPSGLQSAEICRKSSPQDSRPRINVDAVTYSAVKVQKEHLTSQEHE